MQSISVRHRECGGDLLRLEFDTPPTLQDVVSRGMSLLAEDLRTHDHYQAEWPLECDYCGAALSFESGGWTRRPVISSLDRNVAYHE